MSYFIKNLALLILLVIMLYIIILTLWDHMRPSEIKTKCYQELQLKEGETQPVDVVEINNKYRMCLERHGLEPEDIIITDTLIK